MTDGTIALAGNPNTGKSTVFNALTGARQHVGNWPGKTVAKKSGTWRHGGRVFEVIDLPGTYSLAADSVEEAITRDYLVEARPDLVVVVVDAANLERNLYLASQILEMRGRVVLALNMADAAASRGLAIDVPRLSARLGVPVVTMTAHKGRGLVELAAAMTAERRAGGPAELGEPAVRIPYGAELEAEITALADGLPAVVGLPPAVSARWLAIKLLEGGPAVPARLAGIDIPEPLARAVAEAVERLEAATGLEIDGLVADGRYAWIHDLAGEALRRPTIDHVTRSDRIDALVTHRLFGIPIFLAAMWAVFKVTTEVSAPYLDWIAGLIAGPVTNWATRLLVALGLEDSWLAGLLLDGVVAGVGGVLVFVPVLMALYLALALLEDSGYMARAAFVMDRLMRGFGLHGKSFLPMLVGFGCTVPAIYATRTLKSERDRVLTGLLVPFMSCSARLPVYVLFAAVFFPRLAGTVVFAMYLMGIAVAVLLGLLLRRSLFRAGDNAPFVMELPPYRLPTPRGVLTQMWSRTSGFVRKAWTTILLVSSLLWVLMATPAPASAGRFGQTPVSASLFATTAGALAPLFAPLGFGSWEATGALLTGLVAKEVVITTMAQVYGADASAAEPETALPSLAEDLRFIVSSFVAATVELLRSLPGMLGLGPAPAPAAAAPGLGTAIHASFARSSGGHPVPAGLAFMVFVLLYTPCMVAIAAARHEFGARWMWTSVLGQLAVAWLLAFAVFQVGRWLLG